MSNTRSLNLPLVQERQAQKHITINESLKRIDALLHIAVEEIGLNTPPITPDEAAAYIIGATPSGAWSSKENEIAVFQDQVWIFFAPKIGWSVWNKQDNQRYTYYDGNWQSGG